MSDSTVNDATIQTIPFGVEPHHFYPSNLEMTLTELRKPLKPEDGADPYKGSAPDPQADSSNSTPTIATINRHARRRAADTLLLEEPAVDPLQLDPLTCSFRAYRVDRVKVEGRRKSQQSSNSYTDRKVEQPNKLAPLQKTTQSTRESEDAAIEPSEEILCLFNVIVAIEWRPDEEYLQQLEWAFRRASDFLYDVTNGRMAFGQVVFAGSDYMKCADFVITASNQIHPRAWVGGLYDPAKYIPIRLGRGNWPSRNRVTIPWDEPEGFRTIVHEWAHYALGLRDASLQELALTRGAQLPDLEGLSPQRLITHHNGQIKISLPYLTTGSVSIMDNMEGTSELVFHREGDCLTQRTRERNEITKHYPFLPDGSSLTGPNRLPLPLPLFRRARDLVDDSPIIRLVKGEPDLDDPRAAWQVYILKGSLSEPTRILAQGAPDARFRDEGLPLYGASQERHNCGDWARC